MSRGNPKQNCGDGEGAQPSIIPAGTPAWITAELIEQTVRVWQPYYKATLTTEDAVTMILSVGRLYQAFSSGSKP
jgi:hypothetical protein